MLVLQKLSSESQRFMDKILLKKLIFYVKNFNNQEILSWRKNIFHNLPSSNLKFFAKDLSIFP